MRSDLDVVPHLDALWRHAKVLTRDDADADDLVQEALARVLVLGGSYDPARPLRPWLFAVLRNTFLTERSRRKAEADRAEALAIATEDASPADQDSRLELGELVRAFDDLPREYREALHLVGVLGFSYREAAEAMDVPIGTVMSRLNRARAQLRAVVDEPGAAGRPRLSVVGGKDGA